MHVHTCVCVQRYVQVMLNSGDVNAAPAAGETTGIIISIPTTKLLLLATSSKVVLHCCA